MTFTAAISNKKKLVIRTDTLKRFLIHMPHTFVDGSNYLFAFLNRVRFFFGFQKNKTMAEKRTVYVGGLADEVTEQLINDAFIPFGDILEIQMPVDYESQKHRGFAFVEFETAEDAAAAIDNMVRMNTISINHIIFNRHFVFYRTIPN